MPAVLQTPLTASNLTVTAIIIDAQSTQYTVAAVIKDASGKPIRNVEVQGKVLNEQGGFDVPESVNFPSLYADLKTFAYWALNQNGFSNTLE